MAARKSSGSRAFFLELVLDLLIFALCATVCLQVFAAAKSASDLSAAKSNLGIEAQRLAEDFKACEGDLGALATSFSAAEVSGQVLTLYYDKDFAPVASQDEAAYLLSCEASQEGKLHRADILAQRLASSDSETLPVLFRFEVAYLALSGSAGSPAPAVSQAAAAPEAAAPEAPVVSEADAALPVLDATSEGGGA